MILTITYEALINLKDFKSKQIYGAFAGALILFLSYEHLLVGVVYEYQVVYLSALFLAIYLLLVQLYRANAVEEHRLASNQSEIVQESLSEDENYEEDYDYTLLVKTIIAIAFILVATAEILINFGTTGLSATSRTYYVEDNENIDSLLTIVEEEDDSFYRIEKYKRRTKNDASWHGYKGASIFSSTSSEKLNDYLDSL